MKIPWASSEHRRLAMGSLQVAGEGAGERRRSAVIAVNQHHPKMGLTYWSGSWEGISLCRIFSTVVYSLGLLLLVDVGL